uniref:Uncharacterized protein n=1 Tax=Lactuca sativa TaxID=4236 RepID=A0A9R1X6D5_LACSA|nr:hypothetical protein LSAT_V11C600327400 [Lactuca sativa]
MPLTQTSTSIVRHCSHLPPSSLFFRPTTLILTTSFFGGFSQFQSPASIRHPQLGFQRLHLILVTFLHNSLSTVTSTMTNNNRAVHIFKEELERKKKKEHKAVNGSSFLSRRRQQRRSRGRSPFAHLRRIKEEKHDWNQKSGSTSKIGEKQQQHMAVKRCSVPVVESAKGGENKGNRGF